MSSFRIDRQYVSLEAAEVKAVYIPKQTTGKQESSGPEEIEKQSAEIIRRAQQDASEKARIMLERSEADAEAIVNKAKRLADKIIADANRKAEETELGANKAGEDIKEAARRKGYSDGLEAAGELAKARKKEEAEKLQDMVEKLKEEYSQLIAGTQENVISLVMEIVKKIIGVKMDKSDEVFIDIVNDAIGRLKQTGLITIHVGIEDYERYFRKEPPEKCLSTGNVRIAVIEEEEYLRGDLVVESEGEMLDFSIRKQIEKVEKAFSGDEN